MLIHGTSSRTLRASSTKRFHILEGRNASAKRAHEWSVASRSCKQTGAVSSRMGGIHTGQRRLLSPRSSCPVSPRQLPSQHQGKERCLPAAVDITGTPPLAAGSVSTPTADSNRQETAQKGPAACQPSRRKPYCTYQLLHRHTPTPVSMLPGKTESLRWGENHSSSNTQLEMPSILMHCVARPSDLPHRRAIEA